MSALRAASATPHPAFTSSAAIARPMPPLAPVRIARLPVRSRFMSFNGGIGTDAVQF